ncbi:MAG: SH3 domain-containing protein [Defluviitaleaceae bacterium]|nr:SH3 domain-containing protein [Defluviitaleaceae bacterium]
MSLKTFLVGLLLTLILPSVMAFAGEPQLLADAWEYAPYEPFVPLLLEEASPVLEDEPLLLADAPLLPEEAPIVLADAWVYTPEEVSYFITTGRVNLRPSPGTNGTRVALVPPGSRVEVLDLGCGEWFNVSYNGQAGFMYAAHLRELGESGPVEVGTVEKLHWSEARNIVTSGKIFTVVDVRTGISWEMASFSQGNHADSETITAADTALMLSAFGQWQWAPRPILILVDGRTLAASVNGMPHAGSTRSGNNMNGHVCIHFLGSSTHRYAPTHVRQHQAAVAEAYNTARTW